MRGNRYAATGVAAILLAFAGGCGSSDDSSKDGTEALAEGGTFTLALESDPGNLDPSMTPSSVARGMLGLAYDTLVYQNEDGAVVSGLAEQWDVTPKSVTFTLKPGITCSDGSKLTATDVADNISYIGDPKNKSPLMGVVVPGGVKATADDAAGTVKVTAPAPDGFLLTELSGVFIICRAGLDDHKALARTTIGTGPWVLEEAVTDDHYRFTPHEGYAWGPDGGKLEGPGTPDEVNVRIVPNVTTTANLLLSGEVNVGAVNGPDTKRLGDELTTLDNVDTSGETWFNQADGHPAADPAVREALTTGADMATLGKVATGDNAQPSKGFITLQPNPCTGGDSVSGKLPAYDPEQAEQILEDAGWTAGAGGMRSKDGEPLELTFAYDKKGQDARTAGAELLASQWEELGVKVNLKALPEAQLNELFFGTGAWDAAWANFTFNLPTQMVAFVSGPAIPDGANFSSIDNPQYADLAAEATGMVGEESCPTWAQAEAALLTDFNLIPMFDSVSRTYVKNAKLTSVGGQIWGSTLRLLAG